MERPEPSLTVMAVMSAVVVIATVALWVRMVPVWVRAIRTGRLLAKRAIYDRHRSPVMYWAGIFCMLFIALLMTGLGSGLAFETISRLSALLAPK